MLIEDSVEILGTALSAFHVTNTKRRDKKRFWIPDILEIWPEVCQGLFLVGVQSTRSALCFFRVVIRLVRPPFGRIISRQPFRGGGILWIFTSTVSKLCVRWGCNIIHTAWTILMIHDLDLAIAETFKWRGLDKLINIAVEFRQPNCRNYFWRNKTLRFLLTGHLLIDYIDKHIE